MSAFGSPQTPIVVLCGPTASGKSALAVEVAERLGSEIINVDSMQVYRGLDIGTGKPTREQRSRVPHHGVDCVDLGAWYSAAAFKADMDPVLDRLLVAGVPPVVCGGTGLYLRALIDGIFPGPPKDADVRTELHAKAALRGVEALYRDLRDVDPVTAERIADNDERRIVRALEVYRLTGRPISEHQAVKTRGTGRPHALWFAIRREREDVRARIAARVRAMFNAGWVEEVRQLRAAGHEQTLHRLRPLGYVEILDALAIGGTDALMDAERLTTTHTQQFAKRQLTWFRNQHDPEWLDVAPNEEVTKWTDHIVRATDVARRNPNPR